MDNQFLCFIRNVGKDIEGENVYEFLFTSLPDEFWGENFEYMPCCLVNELIPDENLYDHVKTLKTTINLDLIQNSCCFSMQDCTDQIVALAYENISLYETYPEDGRLVLHYGMSYEDVENALSEKKLNFE